MYDIIGDIHGQLGRLEALLAHMGYRQQAGIWQHKSRQAIFVGDFVDRGPQQRELLETVKAMIDAGTALSVMGNHELNAIGWYTPDPNDSTQYLRPRNDKNRNQHTQFLLEIEEDSFEHRRWVEWFKTLPLWLEIDGIRIVHACWDEHAMAVLAPYVNMQNQVVESAWPLLFKKDTPPFNAIENILKGPEVNLPEGVQFLDKDGHCRKVSRIKWWAEEHNLTWPELVMGEEIAQQLPNEPSGYGGFSHTNSTPTFIGHYWLTGIPAKLASNVACVDYSAAVEKGKLVAYRWQGEAVLNDEHFEFLSK